MPRLTASLAEFLASDVADRHLRLAELVAGGGQAWVEWLNDEQPDVEITRFSVTVRIGPHRGLHGVLGVEGAFVDPQVVDGLKDVAAGLDAELKLSEANRRLAALQLADAEEAAFELRLADVATATTRAAGIAATVDALTTHGAPACGASIVSLATMGVGVVRFSHGPGVGAEIEAEWSDVPLDTSVPLVQCVRSGREVVAATPASLDEWPLIADEVMRLGLRSYVALPIVDYKAGIRAALGIGFEEPLADGLVPRPVRRLAELTLSALRSAHRFEVERRQSLTLEQVVLPSELLPFPGFSVGGVYLAPSRTQRIGGDVYDAVQRADGKLVVLIADAVGHDLGATRTVARVRHAVGALAHQLLGPAEILTAVNDYLIDPRRRRTVTAAVLEFDPLNRTVTIGNAGHPSPIMIHDRSAAPLTGSRQPLLGLAKFPYSDARFQLPPGSTILAYTDGLIERRDRSYKIGESGLRSVLGAMPDNDPMAALESVINSVVGEDRDDDLAVIAVAADGRNRAQTLARRRVRMVWTMPDLSLGTARARLRQWLEDRTSRQSVDAVELVVTELLTNGRDASPEGGLVELEVLKGEEWIEVTVSNSGDGFVLSDAMPDENALRGRGLAMVEAVSHTVSVERRMGRTVVTAWIAQQP